MDSAPIRAGNMDIRQQREMWRDFVRLVAAATGAAVLTLILMAIFLI